MYNLTIYTGDYLLVLELAAKLEREFPTMVINSILTKELAAELLEHGMNSDGVDAIDSDFDKIYDADAVLLLTKVPDSNFYKKFDGSIIDATGIIDNNQPEDTIRIADPLFELLNEIALLNKGVVFSISLPMAVYGTGGVDTLMQETRAVYTFENYDGSVLPSRIAFNMHLYRDSLPDGVLAAEIASLGGLATVSTRITPVSTVFMVDIYNSEMVIFPDTDFEHVDVAGDITFEEVATSSDFVLIANSDNFYTLLGDYLNIKTGKILRAVQKAFGGL